MIRFLFTLISGLFLMTSGARAQTVQWQDLNRLYSILPLGYEDPGWRQDNLICLGEHVCALGGKLGQRWNCDSRVSACVGEWRDGRTGQSRLWNLYDCSTFLSDLNPEQAGLLRNPKFCEVPESVSARQPAYDDREVNCLSETWCATHTKLTQQECTKRIEKCSNVMYGMTVSERNNCRASRQSNTEAGRCDLEYRKPVWLRLSEWTPPTTPDRLKILSDSEARCLADEMCAQIASERERLVCRGSYTTCSGNRVLMLPETRETCEAYRRQASEQAICGLYNDSAAEKIPAQAPASGPPRTWQEQAARADAKAEADAGDEFSLGDLDF